MIKFERNIDPKKVLNIGKDRMSSDMTEAMNRLKYSLKKDKDYYIAWQANIAMQFMDCLYWYKKNTGKKYLNRKDFHIIANNSAKNFLHVLCM